MNAQVWFSMSYQILPVWHFLSLNFLDSQQSCPFSTFEILFQFL